jgi:two-component system chemotaxis response regulator CheB
MSKIRVLVVDDSFVIRDILSQSLAGDPDLEVVGAASDAFEARDMIVALRPDVMLLDIALPKMDGVEFLKKLMPQYPMPVIAVTSLDERVFDALAAGALDFIHKPKGMTRSQLTEHMRVELGEKIKALNLAKVDIAKPHDKKVIVADAVIGRPDKEVIAIGASMGGTEAIPEVIGKFDTDIPGVVVAQQMPPDFTAMFAARLNNLCKVAVKEAQNGDRVKQGQVLIAPGGKQTQLVGGADGYYVECKFDETAAGQAPSIDALFNSVAQVAGNKAIGILLTGAGPDGSAGLMELHRHGATTIGQDELTCAVYGMAKTAFEMGAVTYQVGLPHIAAKVYNVLNNKH